MGRNSRTKPLAFSLKPRCHGLCGSQKKMSIFRSALEALEHVLRRVAVELDAHRVAADALDQRAHRRAVDGALDEVALPVAEPPARRCPPERLCAMPAW